jgi:hypothetical protein
MITETATPKDLADQNQFNQNYYFNFSNAWDYERKQWNYDLESETSKKLVEQDLEHLKECEDAFLKRVSQKPKNGDALQMPCGNIVFFCHTWDDSAQTTPHGSFALSDSGYISYSGGLDNGMELKDIYLTDEFTYLPVWICHNKRLKAGCRVNATVKTRLWKCNEDADLSGVQIKRNY